jgi:peptidoglycan L-alanyl-D-glutamate endopeptidase CwlK
MLYSLSQRSLERLSGVHPDLVCIVRRAILVSEVDFAVLEGVRSLERQKELVSSGASTTLRSRHLTGHAVDLGAWVAGGIRWDWPLYHKIAAAMQTSALREKIDIKWGGNWKAFPDGPHFQLPWESHPS